MPKKVSLLIVFAVIITVVFAGCGNVSKPSGQNLKLQVQTQNPTQNSGNSTVTVQKAGVSKNTTTAQNAATSSSAPTEKPIAPEKNPPGDIPDNQVFVTYSSASEGYTLKAPEGWGRTENGNDVKYVDKFDGVQVEITNAIDTFSIDNIKKNQVAALVNTGRAITVKDVKQVKLSGGTAIIVSYDSNSEPGPVTNKQIRLENEKIYFNNGNKLAVLTLWAPLGADNVDQWNLISNSFKWR